MTSTAPKTVSKKQPSASKPAAEKSVTDKSAADKPVKKEPTKTATAKSATASSKDKTTTSKADKTSDKTGQSGTVGDDKPKQRRVVNKEQIDISFEDLIKELNEITEESRESKQNAKLISKIKKVTKNAKTLQSDTARVVKLKPKSNRTGNAQCGFLKQKAISKELANFTGWSPAELKSSVDVTKFLCEYIKANNLSQNCENKRFFKPDAKMHVLFQTNPGYDPKHGDNQQLSYPLIQRLIQIHFPKTTVEAPQA